MCGSFDCMAKQRNQFLYFSAGLGNIDESIYERASVDGANGIQKFFSLTLPGLSPIMFYTLVVNIIQAFQSFGQIKILTEGGPSESTNVIVYSIYRNAFSTIALEQQLHSQLFYSLLLCLSRL